MTVNFGCATISILCFQATFCGSSLGKKKGFHFTAQDFEAMGYDFCDTLLDYCDPDTSKVCTPDNFPMRVMWLQFSPQSGIFPLKWDISLIEGYFHQSGIFPSWRDISIKVGSFPHGGIFPSKWDLSLMEGYFHQSGIFPSWRNISIKVGSSPHGGIFPSKWDLSVI